MAPPSSAKRQLDLSSFLSAPSTSKRSRNSDVGATPNANVEDDASTSSPSLSREAFIAKLGSEVKEGGIPERELLALECETLGESWFLQLKHEIRSPYFLDLKKFLATEMKAHKVFPKRQLPLFASLLRRYQGRDDTRGPGASPLTCRLGILLNSGRHLLLE